MLHKSCEVAQALGAVLMTQIDGHEPQYRSSHLVAKAVAEKLIAHCKDQSFTPGKPIFVLCNIGMGTVLCMAVSTLLSKSRCGRLNQARLIVILPAERQVSNQMVGLLENTLDDIGLALDYYQRHFSYYSRFDDLRGLKTCMICEDVHVSTGQWLRWNEFLGRQLGLGLSHTVCRSCAAFHYPECAGTKNWTQSLVQNRNHASGSSQEGTCVDVCAICENLSTPAGEWVRWDDYLSRMCGVGFTHTLCPACSGPQKIDGEMTNQGADFARHTA